MEEEDFESSRDDQSQIKNSIERYEEMLRNKDAYFFDVDAFLNIVDFYIEKNDPVKALQVIEFAKQQHPASVEFLLREAQLLGMVERHSEALVILANAEKLSPTDPDIFMIRGSIYSQQQKFELAIESFNQAIPLASELDMLYLNIAYVYESWGDYDMAIKYLKLCLEDNSDNEIALYELAFCFEFTNRLSDSAEFYKHFIDRCPYSYPAWYNLGNVYNRIGEYEEALNAYDYCLIIKDDFSSAYFNKGNTLANLSRYSEAIECYKKTFEFEAPDALTYYNIGECYEQLEQMQKARDYYKKATKLDVNLAEAWLGIGITLQNEERWFESVHYFKKAIELNNKASEFWFALGESEYHLNNYVAAETAYKKVIDLEPENMDIWLEYSHLLMVDDRKDEAIELIQTGLIYHIDQPELLYRLACYHYTTGKLSEAYTILQNALEKNSQLCHTLFEYSPKMENDKYILDLVELYKNKE